MTDDDLAARVRAALPGDGVVREVPMFGGLAFMLDKRMVVSVGRDGTLAVRVDPGRSAELLSIPDARPAVMGADRPMGPGWITVAADGLRTDGQLGDWLAVALEHHGRAGPPR
ncbi:TfoX/Sxy family protein [Georgenia faecalis]|uniref:TfoX/Sxy family protein n=1 Tax=Georgenia faecalis TaxID=2483799 RepID=A0ABV9DC09_9MICO|nr:TfoX/Sxy family protein [Georgenia faecalis]